MDQYSQAQVWLLLLARSTFLKENLTRVGLVKKEASMEDEGAFNVLDLAHQGFGLLVRKDASGQWFQKIKQ